MEVETIRLGTGNFIELRALEHGTVAGYSEGDLRIGASIAFDGCSGEYDQIWISKDRWVSFMSALVTLERDRRGQASLIAMSPEEFELHLEVFTPAGRLAARGYLSKYHFVSAVGILTLRSRIEYWIEIDPSLLRELISRFAGFTSASSCYSGSHRMQ